ncbi:MAG: hypothetical protein H6839_08280 [Planctomycetes bacterium]|nr:hypothetical protein [Planctomycetota bacterium]
MRLPVYRCLPALVAAFLLCVLPSCATLNDPLLTATMGELHERGRPVINHDLKPVAEGVPSGITRGAGMEFDPPTIEGMTGTDAAYAYLALALFYVFVYLGYCIGYAFYALGVAIYDACGGDRTRGDGQEDQDGKPDPKHIPQPYPRTK